MDENVIGTSDDGRFRATLEYEYEGSLFDPREDVETGTVMVWEEGGYWNRTFHSLDGPGEAIQTGYLGSLEKAARYYWLAEGRRSVIDGNLFLEDEAFAGTDPSWTLERRDAYLQAVADEHRAWANGEVYHYAVEVATMVDEDGEPSGWDIVDSCCGLIGGEYAEAEALRALDWAVQSDRAPQWGQLTFESTV
jgi:hypothetical protein